MGKGIIEDLKQMLPHSEYKYWIENECLHICEIKVQKG